MPYAIEPMLITDIPEVVEIEKVCFSTPWPASAYKRELNNPKSTRYLVARHYKDGLPLVAPPFQPEKRSLLASIFPFLQRPEENHKPNPNPVVGYGGLWLMMDEAHITTLGVDPTYRGKHLGEFLLIGLTDVAMQLGASWLTLEVRVSNTVAQNLYHKYTFKQQGVRHKYYTDNDEDAYVMWSDEITKPEFRQLYTKLKRDLFERLSNEGELATLLDPTKPILVPEISPATE
jgi:[ribosomal protein S18]-alanine N-acetyltransferase